jgi:RHS repeat-associated protein
MRNAAACTWDDNGNLTSDGVRSYAYDHANRLTQVTEGSLTTQFAYNGDGVRTSKTVSGDTTEYLLDLLATLPVVISDTEAVYLYGLDIIAQQQDERLYYVHDGLGSVRQLLDTTGEIETNYAYDPFGVPLAGGEVYNPYQYTGEAWDAEVGLLYLRARYYQPEAGRFITSDPIGADPERPSVSHRWVYVANNPVSMTDPSGMAPLSGAYSAVGGTVAYWWDDRDLTWWLYQEMVRNVAGPDATEIRQLLGSWNPLDKYEGTRKWISLVADRCRWDFKHRIYAQLGDNVMLRHIASGAGGYRWYEYSVPGNIYFGWMGMAVGFPDWFLHVGAGVAEIIDPVHQEKRDCTITRQIRVRIKIDVSGVDRELEQNICINPDWCRSNFDEPGDWWNVEFGIRLYKTHGPALAYGEWLTFLGSHGRLLTPAPAMPHDVGRHRNTGFPYGVGYFNGPN